MNTACNEINITHLEILERTSLVVQGGTVSLNGQVATAVTSWDEPSRASSHMHQVSVPLPGRIYFVQITGREMPQARQSVAAMAYWQLKIIVTTWLLVETKASLRSNIIAQTQYQVYLLVTEMLRTSTMTKLCVLALAKTMTVLRAPTGAMTN